MSLLSTIGGIAGAYFGGPTGAAIGSSIGDTISTSSAQREANQFNTQAAQENRDFQERMSSTAYQRQAKDMEAAGLNPMLAYLKTSGASSPVGAQASYPVGANVASSSSSYAGQHAAAATKQSVASAQQADTAEKRQRAEQQLTEAQVKQVDATADKIKQELDNMPKGLTMGRSVSEWNTEAIRFAVEKVKDESTLLRQRDQSEQVYQNQMRALIDKLKNETALGKLDLKAAEDMLNAGRLGKELEPFARMLFSVMRAMR